jgi:integrase
MLADPNPILLNEVSEKLSLIMKKLGIVPDLEITITDFEASVTAYEAFALDELKLGQTTIDNQKSAIRNFLAFSNGVITKETVTLYLDSNESDSWKSNQLKALRRYTRDFLKLGNWAEDFHFKTNVKLKIKKLPSDEEVLEFFRSLPTFEIQIVFLMLYSSGLRIGEVLSLQIRNIGFADCSIDATEIHEGQTKHSWFSFFTNQTADHLENYIKHTHGEMGLGDDYRIESTTLLFPISKRTVQNAFQKTSELTGIEINPHLLRSIFTDKCTKAGIKDKYIDAFCGRTSKGVLAKHYTDYSVESLREQYDRVEDYLTISE